MKFIVFSDCKPGAQVHIQYIASERSPGWIEHTNMILCTSDDDIQNMKVQIKNGLDLKSFQFLKALSHPHHLDW